MTARLPAERAEAIRRGMERRAAPGRGGVLAAALVAGGYLLAARGGVFAGTASGPVTPASVQSSAATGERMAAAYGWTGGQWTCLNELWTRESNWNPWAANPTSDARGIPQNINGWSAYAPGDVTAQVRWGLAYIRGRYGTPCRAWAHETADNWY